MSADQPLTGDELATIKTRAEAPACEFERHGDGQCAGSGRGLWCWPCMDARDTLRLVAEIERLQAEKDAILGQSEQAYRLLRISGDLGPAATLLAQMKRWPEFVERA